MNSRHKSAIVETKLDIIARSDDNIIEAVEDNSKTFFLENLQNVLYITSSITENTSS